MRDATGGAESIAYPIPFPIRNPGCPCGSPFSASLRCRRVCYRRVGPLRRVLQLGFFQKQRKERVGNAFGSDVAEAARERRAAGKCYLARRFGGSISGGRAVSALPRANVFFGGAGLTRSSRHFCFFRPFGADPWSVVAGEWPKRSPLRVGTFARLDGFVQFCGVCGNEGFSLPGTWSLVVGTLASLQSVTTIGPIFH